MILKKVLAVLCLVTTVWSGEMSFYRKHGPISESVNTAFIFPEMVNSKIDCEAYEITDDTNMKLIWKLEGVEVGGPQSYNSASDTLSSTYEVKPEDSGKNLDCILNVVISGTTVQTHKHNLKVAKIELKFDFGDSSKVYAPVNEEIEIKCVVSGYSFNNFVGVEDVIPVIRELTGNTIVKSGYEVNAGDGTRYVSYKVTKGSADDIKYRCELDDFGGNGDNGGPEVTLDVKYMALDTDLEKLYYVAENGVVDLTGEIEEFDWADAGYPKSKWYSAGRGGSQIPGAIASYPSATASDSPIYFEFEYRGSLNTEGSSFYPDFSLRSKEANIIELKIAAETNIVAGDTMTVTCTIVAQATAFSISLMRDNVVLQSTDPVGGGYESKFSSGYQQLTDGVTLQYKFEISDMTKGTDDQNSYKCDIAGKTSSNALKPVIFELQSSGNKVWLLNAGESSPLTCFIEGSDSFDIK